MKSSQPTKILIIGNIKKDNTLLLRKKFPGSKPYKETWYSFGCELIPGESPGDTFKNYIKEYLNISIKPLNNLFWDTETKEDHDGTTKQFIYLDLETEYVSGNIKKPKELEKVEFIPMEKLSTLGIVPPSVKMFQRLGYLKK